MIVNDDVSVDSKSNDNSNQSVFTTSSFEEIKKMLSKMKPEGIDKELCKMWETCSATEEDNEFLSIRYRHIFKWLKNHVDSKTFDYIVGRTIIIIASKGCSIHLKEILPYISNLTERYYYNLDPDRDATKRNEFISDNISKSSVNILEAAIWNPCSCLLKTLVKYAVFNINYPYLWHGSFGHDIICKLLDNEVWRQDGLKRVRIIFKEFEKCNNTVSLHVKEFYKKFAYQMTELLSKNKSDSDTINTVIKYLLPEHYRLMVGEVNKDDSNYIEPTYNQKYGSECRPTLQDFHGGMAGPPYMSWNKYIYYGITIDELCLGLYIDYRGMVIYGDRISGRNSEDHIIGYDPMLTGILNTIPDSMQSKVDKIISDNIMPGDSKIIDGTYILKTNGAISVTKYLELSKLGQKDQ